MARPPFVTLEGIDGSGKTSQLPRIAEWFRSRGTTPVVVREPGATLLGEALRSLVLDDPRGQGMAALTEALLMLAARAELVDKVIRPALAHGQPVICDRFADSTLAYQGYGLGVDLDWLAAANRRICGDVWPDLTLLFDLPPAQAAVRNATSRADRIGNRGGDFGVRVRQGFLAIAAAEPDRIRVIDAGAPPEDVWRQVEAHLESLWAARCAADGGRRG